MTNEVEHFSWVCHWSTFADDRMKKHFIIENKKMTQLSAAAVRMKWDVDLDEGNKTRISVQQISLLKYNFICEFRGG